MVALTWELGVGVSRYVGRDDEDPYGSAVRIELGRNVVKALGDQHPARLRVAVGRYPMLDDNMLDARLCGAVSPEPRGPCVRYSLQRLQIN